MIKMHKHKKQGRGILSNKHIHELSKKLVEELSKSQLILLIRNITSQLSENSNNFENDSETFAESLDMDTSHSDISDLPKMFSKSEFYLKHLNETTYQLDDEIPNENRAMITTKGIIARQCGDLKQPLQNDSHIQYYSGTCNKKCISDIKNSLNDVIHFNEVTPSNDNNSINEKYIFQDMLIKNQLKINCYPYEFKSIEETDLHTKKKYLSTKCLRSITGWHLEINSEYDEILSVTNFQLFPETPTVSYEPCRLVTPLILNRPGIIRPCKLIATTRKISPVSRISKFNHSKENVPKMDKLDKKHKKTFYGKSVKFNTTTENLYVKTLQLDSKQSLNKLLKVRANSNWVCTYVSCKHLNTMSSISCRVCFNPRWNPHIRFVRNFLCSRCGYVNYKTRVSCKKCNFKLMSQFDLKKCLQMYRISSQISARGSHLVQQRHSHFHL